MIWNDYFHKEMDENYDLKCEIFNWDILEDDIPSVESKTGIAEGC